MKLSTFLQLINRLLIVLQVNSELGPDDVFKEVRAALDKLA